MNPLDAPLCPHEQSCASLCIVTRLLTWCILGLSVFSILSSLTAASRKCVRNPSPIRLSTFQTDVFYNPVILWGFPSEAHVVMINVFISDLERLVTLLVNPWPLKRCSNGPNESAAI